MKPCLVIVHGIGNARSPEELRRTWLEALVRGAVAAGHSRAAASLADGERIDVVAAAYGDLFQPAEAQGGSGEMSEQDAELVIGLLDDLVEQQLGVVSDEHGRSILTEVRDQLRPVGTPQGVGNLVRIAGGAITTLLEWKPLLRTGQWATSRLLFAQLAQVSRYLNRGESDGQATLDQRIRGRVHACLGGDGPAIVVAHSLGSVVAFEALHEFDGQVPLFATLGSPLGMRTVVWPRLRSQPPATPEPVRRWLNFWDRDDVFVSRPRMEADLRANGHGVRPRSSRIDSDGLWVHTATKYLAQPAVAGPIMEAVSVLEDMP